MSESRPALAEQEAQARGRDAAEEPRPSRALAVRLRVQQLRLVRIWGLWVTIAVTALVFDSVNSAFFAGGNLLDLVRAASSLAIIALGLTVVIIAGELDLSIGATYSLSAVVLASLWIDNDYSVYAALPIAMASGVAVGLFNGFFAVVTRIPSFVVTLGSLSLVQGVAVLVGHVQIFSPAFVEPPLPKSEVSFFHDFGGSAPGGVPTQVIWMLGIALVFVFVLHRSLFGFRIAAIGGNPDAARVARLPVRRYRIIAFVICGFLAGLAGIIDFSFLGSTQSSTSGTGLTFPAFAAVIIGGASLTGGAGTVIGTLSGALLLQVLQNGLSLIGVGAGWQLVFIGGVTIAAVGIDRWAAFGPIVGQRARAIISARRGLAP